MGVRAPVQARVVPSKFAIRDSRFVIPVPCPSRMRKNPLLPRLLKKVHMQGGARCEVRGVLSPYVAAPRERANAADGPFSAAC